MQLLLVIVQAEDADVLLDRLVANQFRATRINSVGSFLARGNATVLIGVEEARVERVLEIMRATCHTRKAFVNAMPQVETASIALAVPMPLEVLVGGATVFAFPVARFLRLRGGATPPALDEEKPFVPAPEDRSAANRAEEGSTMNLILAIVQNEDTDAVVGGLVAAGYRVTRLNTAGGFLRRGNVTLLIGTESKKVDDVLSLLQANCRERTEARPAEAGMPMYSATVFVLEASRFLYM